MSTRIKKSKKTVSLLTITQFKRFKSLTILYEMIKKQTYKDINEWVIVEGTQSKSEAEINKNKIKEFIEQIKPEINYKVNYIEYTGLKLGGLRNLGNVSCTSDIIVCLDDDDYYPPERIEHAVDTLNNSKCMIGGVSDVYLYDFFLDKLYKFKGFMEFHSTNNCMAYKKEFLLNHKHDPEIEVGEERSFTYEFTSPLVKFNSRKTIIAISHNFNTFNKRELCMGGTLKNLHTLTQIDEPITNYIDPEIFVKMKELYVIKEPSPYNVVIYCGAFNHKLEENNKISDKNVDVPDTALIKLSNYWVSRGKKVAIYGEFNETNDILFNNVNFIHWKKFPFQHTYNILILWKTNGFMCGVPFPIEAKKVYWDSYDNFVNNPVLVEFWKNYGHKVNKIFFKSNFHKIEFEHYLGTPPDYEIIPSGLYIEKFTYNWDNVVRNPYRFCYVNHYDRGLEFIITGIFSVIKKIEPRAELHIYGGMDHINDNNYKQKMLKIFSENGVCEHGPQSVDIIAREKHMSTFELYISNIINEVDCVSIRESVLSGCIPLLANFGVFLEREGIKFDMNHEDTKIMQKIALHILKLMKTPSEIDNLRQHFKYNMKTVISWNQVGELMYKSF
jgi:hypothetical protein